MKNGIQAGIVISDIRNFTGTFQKMTQVGLIDNYLEWMDKFYDLQIKIASKISDNYWYNNLGDSMLFIFMGDNHCKNAFTFSIYLHRSLTKMCEDFNEIYGTDISFGIGVDSGEISQRIIRNNGKVDSITYLGDVINWTKRIEAQTKLFGETELLVGGNIYDEMMQDLYPSDYSGARLFKTNYSEILKSKPSLVLMSENIMLYYIFKLKLAGIENPLPLFRYDNDLSEDDNVFWAVIHKMIGEKRMNKLKELE
jgi:hypothetical protein